MTNGWTDEAVAMFAEEFECLADPVALDAVVSAFLRSATDTFRPALGTIVDAYRAEVVRRQTSRALPPGPGDGVFPWRQGIQTMLENYRAEMIKRGKVPNDQRAISLLARCYEPSSHR
jgi:hypothetical protein